MKTYKDKVIEAFDKLEAVDDMMLGISIPYIKLFGPHNVKHLKSFILKSLSDYRDEIIKIIKKSKTVMIIPTTEIPFRESLISLDELIREIKNI